MVAPTNPYSAVTLVEIQAGKPCKQELKEKFRSNNLNAFDVLLAAGVSPGDAAVAVGHRHLGPAVDGTATISAQPQENQVAGGHAVEGFSTDTNVPTGNISWHNGLNFITPRRIQRSDGSNYYGGAGDKRDRLIVYKAILPTVNLIKSSGGKGVFACSHFIRRRTAALGVVGGTYRFGLYDGGWISGAYVTCEFDCRDDNEFARFFFVSDQIARPTTPVIRFEWLTQPTDWDTVNNGDVIGYMGGVMVANGAGIPKFDISHLDGGADAFLAAPTDDEVYWWDENIEEVQKTV